MSKGNRTYFPRSCYTPKKFQVTRMHILYIHSLEMPTDSPITFRPQSLCNDLSSRSAATLPQVRWLRYFTHSSREFPFIEAWLTGGRTEEYCE